MSYRGGGSGEIDSGWPALARRARAFDAARAMARKLGPSPMALTRYAGSLRLSKPALHADLSNLKHMRQFRARKRGRAV